VGAALAATAVRHATRTVAAKAVPTSPYQDEVPKPLLRFTAVIFLI